MAMLNVSTLITGYDTVGDHTEFIVEISCNGGLWRISRRFSDFDQLHSRLVRRFGDLIEVTLPEKQWFGRFDPNFLMKRQASLQEYLDGLLQVPGILDDVSLQHFLELEKHMDLHNELGAGSNNRSSGMWSGKGVLSENDRLSAIVESAAQAFIDISEVPEPLEAEHAVQRKKEIVTASQNLLNEQKLGEQFSTKLTTLRLPQIQAQVSNDELLSRLDGGNEDSPTYNQEQEILWGILENLETSLCMDIKPPSVDLLAVMTVSTIQEAPVVGCNGSLPSGTGTLEAGSLDDRSSLGNGSFS
ncbi:sorting nexin [Plasmopara halstedii]|uniref:Sorting nexin n=1 Tax=Plasmopara halstedii TaxID=4781 RepID=A0A0P1AJH3_PLAHL|nr:sorting nexin [Plasmopara halstedii]CEG40918.1 sorting nexin [Plasmopara halstedii]|eukprot:XP_024577287.1 sorting nexin [Plasmopara halstedii]